MEWPLLHIHTVTHNFPPGSYPLTTIYTDFGWLEPLGGLNALLKDMSNNNEEWFPLAFLPTPPFIILILHSLQFICNNLLQTPSLFCHHFSTFSSFPSITVSPLSPPELRLPPFPPPTASIITSVGSVEWQFDLGWGGQNEQGTG